MESGFNHSGIATSSKSIRSLLSTNLYTKFSTEAGTQYETVRKMFPE